MSCYRKTGDRDVVLCKAGSALAKGDIVQSIEGTGARTVDNAATNVPVFGVTEAAAASGADVSVDVIHPGDRFIVSVTGTVSDTTLLKFGDIVDETGVTTTASNNDVRFVGWDGKTTSEAIVVFTTPEVSAPTATV